jgi:hypothetical protein
MPHGAAVAVRAALATCGATRLSFWLTISAKLRRQGPRTEANVARRMPRAATSGASECQAACRPPHCSCARGFSPGPAPGATSFSAELATTTAFSVFARPIWAGTDMDARRPSLDARTYTLMLARPYPLQTAAAINVPGPDTRPGRPLALLA